MMFTKSFAAVAVAVSALAGLVGAAPLEQRDVYAPKVLYPHAGTVWESGQRHNVTWDASNPPKSISNRAFILLRGGQTEFPFIIAQDFDLRAGRVEITVPKVFSRDDYSIVLFGDSGNWGETFTINNPDGF